jgi:hypothetical protein
MTAPIKADALGTAVTFDYDGTEYTVPAASDWPVDALESFEDGKIIATVRAILGAAQWKTFKAASPKVSQLNEMFGALQAATIGGKGN